MIDAALEQLNGTRLTRVAGTFHAYNGRVSREPIALWLTFDGSTTLRFAGASDGWRLTVDTQEPHPMGMQEHGAIVLQHLDAIEPFAAAMNERLRHVFRISSPTPDITIGIRFDFDSGTIRILNWGDELLAAPTWPTDANVSEVLEVPIA